MAQDDNRIGSLLTQELLDELDALWPATTLPPYTAKRAFVIHAAQRQLIETLRLRFERANANILHPTK